MSHYCCMCVGGCRPKHSNGWRTTSGSQIQCRSQRPDWHTWSSDFQPFVWRSHVAGLPLCSGCLSWRCLHYTAQPTEVTQGCHQPTVFLSADIHPLFLSQFLLLFFYKSNQAAVLQYTLIVRCTFSLTGLAIIYGPMSFCVQYSVFHSFISKFYVGWGLCFYVGGWTIVSPMWHLFKWTKYLWSIN